VYSPGNRKEKEIQKNQALQRMARKGIVNSYHILCLQLAKDTMDKTEISKSELLFIIVCGASR
jgi:hypothetical protein